jgi:hypothetical protein
MDKQEFWTMFQRQAYKITGEQIEGFMAIAKRFNTYSHAQPSANSRVHPEVFPDTCL